MHDDLGDHAKEEELDEEELDEEELDEEELGGDGPDEDGMSSTFEDTSATAVE